MDLELLESTLAARGEPGFRARQVWAWTARGAGGYEQMTDLPSQLREALAVEVPFTSLSLREEARSSDGTVKALFETHDGRPLEAVLMRYRDGRRSICLSSQSGCPLTCRFCATGRMKFGRNLSASEMLEQALHLARVESHRPGRHTRTDAGNARLPRAGALTNCVFMGMGEPMLNLDAVLQTCERLPDLGVSHRHTTISTVGWIPGIERLAESEMPVRLALSLHAADEALRSELMPVNERYPLADVLDACRAFYARRKRRVFVEYVMLAGVNDRYEQALALARALRGGDRGRPSIFKVNLIPYNPSGGGAGASAGTSGSGEDDADPFTGSSRESIAAFQRALTANDVPSTVRLTRGRDIAAACGQLAGAAAARSRA